VGNPDVLGVELDGYLHTTSWALMALDQPTEVDVSWPFYARVLERPSTLNLSLAILAHVSHDRDPAPFVEALLARQATRGLGVRVDTVALAALALRAADTGTHPFRLRGPDAHR
jgi:hypothetical protein